MGNTNQPKLSIDDINLMIKISKHGFVDMLYAYQFYKKGCKKRTIRERIKQLAMYKYLTVINTFIPKEFTYMQETGYSIIALGDKGIDLMNNILDQKITDNSDVLRKASPYRMYHQVQVSTVCDTIEMHFEDSEKTKFEVAEIFSEKELYIEESNNMPDAMILFKTKKKYTIDGIDRYIAVFIELERSYASPKRIRSKLISYENVIKDKTYIKRIGLPIMDQRVLFVAQTDQQYETVRDKIAEVDYKDVSILTTKYKDICIDALDRVCEDPKTNEMYGLLSRLKSPDELKQRDV